MLIKFTLQKKKLPSFSLPRVISSGILEMKMKIVLITDADTDSDSVSKLLFKALARKVGNEG